MTTPLADRLLDQLGDPGARMILRRLLAAPATQAELRQELGCDQSTVSRAIAALRMLGLVTSTGSGRSTQCALEIEAELVAVLLAADRLAEALIERETQRQQESSDQTRRLAIRPRKADEGEAGTAR